ncbi:MAG: hypothetical protein QXF25_01495 [Candidatus Pacearchaeota archaeon]
MERKPFILSIVMGLLAVIISAAILVIITYKTGRIFGIITFLSGVVCGGATGWGYKIGKGKIVSKNDAQFFLTLCTIFGAVGVIAAYLGPYLILFSKFLSLNSYLNLLKFGILDILFIVLGAFGGRWAGKKVALSILINQAYEQQEKKYLKKKTKTYNK